MAGTGASKEGAQCSSASFLPQNRDCSFASFRVQEMWCAGTSRLPRSCHGCLAGAAVAIEVTGGVWMATMGLPRAVDVQWLHMGAGQKC
jgi:hypothetical protein